MPHCVPRGEHPHHPKRLPNLRHGTVMAVLLLVAAPHALQGTTLHKPLAAEDSSPIIYSGTPSLRSSFHWPASSCAKMAVSADPQLLAQGVAAGNLAQH
eukprot:2904099-Amphidinium_carterae.1